MAGGCAMATTGVDAVKAGEVATINGVAVMAPVLIPCPPLIPILCVDAAMAGAATARAAVA
jgi:hypothetical protein